MSTNAVVHDFRERLEFSAGLSDEPAWVEFYRTMWPSLVTMVRIDKNCQHQKWGIDRIIYLPTGREVTVDEKKRERNKITGRVYDDFLLEQYSDLDRRTPGWTLDPSKRCDFVAYAIPDIAKCYLLPFEILRLTCTRNLHRWKLVKPVIAHNNGWRTQNWPVPWGTLFAAMEEEMKREFGGGVPLELPVGQKIGEQTELFEWAAPKPKATPHPFSD